MPHNIDHYQSPTRTAPRGNANNPPTVVTYPGIPQSAIDAYNQSTMIGMAQIDAAYAGISAAAGGSGAAARQAARDRLKFGLRGLDLDRANLGLQRETAGLNRRDALEAAVNNALQRGIYQSGIRVRNEARVEERADIVDKTLDIAGKRINLSEEELRASVKNALAAINEAARSARAQAAAQADLERWRYEMERRQARDRAIAEDPYGIAPPSYVIDRPGGVR